MVDVEVDYGREDTFLFATNSNLSEMGIFIQSRHPYPSGTSLNVRFRPPGRPEINVEGKVVWINDPRKNSHDPGMGVQFVDVTPAQRDQILYLVKKFAYLGPIKS
jgi:type IV pilus assembly protein PilZ